MSALSPHIKALRAEAAALKALSDERCEAAKGIKSVEGVAISLILLDLASAKTRAADALEAEDQELIARFKTGEKVL